MGEDSCNGDDLAHERQVAMLGPGAVGALAGEAVADGATCAVRQHLIANLIKGLKQYPAVAHLDLIRCTITFHPHNKAMRPI